MLVLGVLFFPLVAALLVFLVGNKQAKYVAFSAALVEFVAAWSLKRSLAESGLPSLAFS